MPGRDDTPLILLVKRCMTNEKAPDNVVAFFKQEIIRKVMQFRVKRFIELSVQHAGSSMRLSTPYLLYTIVRMAILE